MKLCAIVHLKNGDIVNGVTDEYTEYDYREVLKVVRDIKNLKYFCVATSKSTKCYFNPDDISYIEIITPEN